MKIYILLCFMLNVFMFNMYGQKSKIVKANLVQKKYVFIDTIKTYERVAEKGYKSIDMFKKMGDGYFLNSQLDKAVRWYCELFTMTYKLESEYFFRYAESLKSVGENEEADKIMELFNRKSKDIKEKI
ncbi:MAG: flagellar motor protein MotB [Flavobacterium sp.]|nr:flagellar motor protein MotB [Flavobacterium sp.]